MSTVQNIGGIVLPKVTQVNTKMKSVSKVERAFRPRRKSNRYTEFQAVGPDVTLPSSNITGTIRSWGSSANGHEIRVTAIARGRATKRVNAWTAVLCGALPALALGLLFPTRPPRWLAGFVVGFLWASLFEYAYHRFLLHLPGTFFARRHLEHHASVGTPTEAEHVNLGSSPIWVVALFAINGIPVVAADLLFGLRIAPGMLLAFTVYFITTEEFHWRIHLGEWLPPGFHAARAYHLAHHARPDARFNIFLPLWDTLLGPVGK